MEQDRHLTELAGVVLSDPEAVVYQMKDDQDRPVFVLANPVFTQIGQTRQEAIQYLHWVLGNLCLQGS